MTDSPSRKLLVANRGEIAIRIFTTARRMGFRTIAVFSDADREAAHVRAADEAVSIGGSPPSQSYLNIEGIVEAAARSQAHAIHPGYGFLSESADFAERVQAAGLVFVGPPADAIRLMGNKRAAKEAMAAAGVPIVPGSDPSEQSDEALARSAARIGYPIMVKAAAGGGGRGMRWVSEAAGLRDALAAARREAQAAFGCDELILEKGIEGGRHVELQVFADAFGSCIHLGERDCSVQRRHQKVLEESPSPAVGEALRKAMGAAATQAARACGYLGAGTVEFLLDANGDFYFLEMNTRLQVEHPVTEAVTGLDLVEWQLRVAAGEPLPLQQPEIRLSGHAIEARVYAEDPATQFVPQTGPLVRWSVEASPAVRVDAGVEEGDRVSLYYDAMLAKVIAYGESRQAARVRLIDALSRSTVFGVRTNRDLLMRLLEDGAFARGEATTGFIAERFGDSTLREAARPRFIDWARAALILFLESGRQRAEDDSLIGWRSGGPVWTSIGLRSRGVTTPVQIEAEGKGQQGRSYTVRRAQPGALGKRARDPKASEHDAEPQLAQFELLRLAEGELVSLDGGARRRVRYAVDGQRLWTDDGSVTHCFEDVTHAPPRTAQGAIGGALTAPLDGSVVVVNAKSGERVQAGQVLAVVEAMKMEHPIQATFAGTVRRVAVSAGTQVRARQVLIEIEPEGKPS